MCVTNTQLRCLLDLDGALRLNRSSSFITLSTSGRLEIYVRGQWGTVCDDSFGFTEAELACRQLGFATVSNYGNTLELG